MSCEYKRKRIVSAYPLNRVCRGHQRPKEQTSDGYFVNYDFDDRVTDEIETEFAIQSVEVRPTFNLVAERKVVYIRSCVLNRRTQLCKNR